jgi:DNA-binding PadR family transcriptional regulator
MPREKLTTPDLVLLSLLTERPAHGYQVNEQLEERKIRDWAGVSRPQIYYSLEKLARLGLISAVDKDAEQAGRDETERDARGPDRRVFEATSAGRMALADSLEREEWAQGSDRPPFLTWLGLSSKCRPGIFLKQLRRRQEFLNRELAGKQRTLQDVLTNVASPFHESVWMLSLTIEQLRTEIAWLDQISREFPRRPIAKTTV